MPVNGTENSVRPESPHFSFFPEDQTAPRHCRTRLRRSGSCGRETSAGYWSPTAIVCFKAHICVQDAAGLESVRRGGPPPVALVINVSRSSKSECPLLLSDRDAGIDDLGLRTHTRLLAGGIMTTLAPILESFFAIRLLGQRRASANTVAPYRDAFRLL